MGEQVRRHLHGQPRLADAAGTSEGEQADLFLEQQMLDSGKLVVAPDEARARQAYVACRRFDPLHSSSIAVSAELGIGRIIRRRVTWRLCCIKSPLFVAEGRWSTLSSTRYRAALLFAIILWSDDGGNESRRFYTSRNAGFYPE